MRPAFELPSRALAAFRNMSDGDKAELLQQAVGQTVDQVARLRVAVREHRRARVAAGLAESPWCARSTDACRTWAVLARRPDALRCELRESPYPRSGRRGNTHIVAFLFLDGRRIDPLPTDTQTRDPAFSCDDGRMLSLSHSGRGRASACHVRYPDGECIHLAAADSVTLRASVRLLLRSAQPAPRAQDDIVDPCVITPMQRVGDAWLKRDDLFVCNGARGAKARSILRIAQGARTAGVGVVVAGSRVSPMISRVARVCEAVGVPCRFHVGRSQVLSDEEQDAIDHGADMIKHADVPFLRKILPRAEADAHKLGWVYVPFGVDCSTHLDEVARQVTAPPAGVKRIVVPVGSGMALAGVLRGLARVGSTVDVLGVRVSERPVDQLLDRHVPDWSRRVRFVRAAGAYECPVADSIWRGVRLDPFYEAKAVPFLLPGDLLWIVAIRAAGCD